MVANHEIAAIRRHYETRPAEATLHSLKLTDMGGGTNPKRRAVTPDGTRFVVKWSKNNDNRVPEINGRDQLTAVLGSLVGVPVVQAWVLPSASLPDAGLPPDEANAPLVRNKCVVMPFLDGPTVAVSKPASAIRVAWNPATVADIFAFMHWSGTRTGAWTT